MKTKTEDLRILEINDVITPSQLHEEYPIDNGVSATVTQARQEIHNILMGEDDRLLVVVGPCSIHDPTAALEYAQRLQGIRDELQKELMIVMRVYFEKPRTTVGWKGLINDPNLDNSFEINKGLALARKLLLDINAMGVPAGTEFLDLITPQYLADLVSWGAIGARTTESQLHRELASGLSCPIGFKNGTDGTLNIAIDAVRAANRPHHFLSMTMQGRSAIFSTSGNEDCHVILRGGKQPNYDADSVNLAARGLREAGLAELLMIDLSHANSRKQFDKQLEVGADVASQIAKGDQRIMGVMIESHLKSGRQDVKPGQELVYGQSITDGCISWEKTTPLLRLLADAVNCRRSAASL
ncbi:MAG: phospho-2-dehydro-3-deoxyheptonate aldolase [Gammaproteobacteria bacterium SG8_11]|nr:MAG: phospho-2-dehydro-3-deoxyheptonate aldolase [Gammaproteobacteria bacterium SG8_11]